MTTWRIAWRNLWRNRRRTGLALAAIGLSQALVLSYDGVLRGYGGWMVATVTGPMLGHVQAHAPEWRRDRAVDRVIPDADAAVAALRADPEVAGATARAWAPALAAVGTEGHAVLVVGVDPAQEAGTHGLLAGAGALPEGRRVLVGTLLAQGMGARTGDSLALIGQGADGSLANDLFVVAGTLDSSVDAVNRHGVVLALAEARELLALGGTAHEIVVRARDPDRAEALAERLRGHPALAGLEVLPWKALAPEMVSLIDLVYVAGFFLLVVVFVAAAAGVANTMLMATFERTGELGMLLALGTGPGRVVRLVLAEALALGLAGSAAGTALGGGLVLAFARRGVNLAALAGGGPEQLSFAGTRWSMLVHPELAAADVAQTVGAVLLTSLLAAAWPAFRAARLEPAGALRT
ncbi:MAG TPA: FtsX-like permease family protein [Anaeromyxobacteraceae bacterium]